MPAELLDTHVRTLGIELRGGRAETAPALASLELYVLSIETSDPEDDKSRWARLTTAANRECEEASRKILLSAERGGKDAKAASESRTAERGGKDAKAASESRIAERGGKDAEAASESRPGGEAAKDF